MATAQASEEVTSPPSSILSFAVSWPKLIVSLCSIVGSFVVFLLTGYYVLIKIMYGDLDARVHENTSQIQENLKMQGRFEAFFQDTLPKFTAVIDKSMNESQDLGLKIAKTSLRMGDLAVKIDDLKESVSETNKTNKDILLANLGLKNQLDELASDIRYLKSKTPVRKGALGEMVVGAAKETGAFDEKIKNPPALKIAQLGGPMMSPEAFGMVRGTDNLAVLSYAGSTDLYKLYSLFLPKQRGVFAIAKHKHVTKTMLALKRRDQVAGYFDR